MRRKVSIARELLQIMLPFHLSHKSSSTPHRPLNSTKVNRPAPSQNQPFISPISPHPLTSSSAAPSPSSPSPPPSPSPSHPSLADTASPPPSASAPSPPRPQSRPCSRSVETSMSHRNSGSSQVDPIRYQRRQVLNQWGGGGPSESSWR